MNAVATAFRVCERSCGCVIACACVYVYVGLCVCMCVCAWKCVCACVCMCCFREENGGKSAADAQVVGEDAEDNGGKSAAVATAANGVKSVAVETAVGEVAAGESAKEIADKNQVVFFSYAALRCSPPLSDSATLRQCNCGVHSPSQKVFFCCYACPSAVSTAA